MQMTKVRSRWCASGLVAVFVLAGCSANSSARSDQPTQASQTQQEHQSERQPDISAGPAKEAGTHVPQVRLHDMAQRADDLGHMLNPETESVNWVVQNSEAFVLSGFVRNGAEAKAVSTAWSSAFHPSETWAGILDQDARLSSVMRTTSGLPGEATTTTTCQVVGAESLPPSRWKNKPISLEEPVARPIENWVQSILGDRFVSLKTEKTSSGLKVTVKADAGQLSLIDRQQETVLVAVGLAGLPGTLEVDYVGLTDQHLLTTDLGVIRAWAKTDGIPVFDEVLVSVDRPYSIPKLPAQGADRGLGWRPQQSVTPDDLVQSATRVAGSLNVTHGGVYGGGGGRVLMISLPAPSTSDWVSPLVSLDRGDLDSIFAKGDNLTGVILVRRAGRKIQAVEVQINDWLTLDTLVRLKPDVDFHALGYLPFKSTLTFTCES